MAIPWPTPMHVVGAHLNQNPARATNQGTNRGNDQRVSQIPFQSNPKSQRRWNAAETSESTEGAVYELSISVCSEVSVAFHVLTNNDRLSGSRFVVSAARVSSPGRCVRGDRSGRASRQRVGFLGRSISNTAPPSFRAVMVPPCASMIALTIDSPRPLPPDALEASTL